MVKFFSTLLKCGFVILVFNFLNTDAVACENCSLESPPRTAGVTGSHGFFYFVYPRSIPNNYSGCQIMWDEHGGKWFVLNFSNGDVVKYEGMDPGIPSEQILCLYKNKKLQSGDGAVCPAFEAINGGIRVLPQADEFIVPKARDPRR